MKKSFLLLFLAVLLLSVACAVTPNGGDELHTVPPEATAQPTDETPTDAPTNVPNADAALPLYWSSDAGESQQVLFRYDLNGDGVEEEISYATADEYGDECTITAGTSSVTVTLDWVSNAMLVAADGGFGLLVSGDMCSSDYATYQFLYADGALTKIPEIWGSLEYADGVITIYESYDILGTRTAGRVYTGFPLTTDTDVLEAYYVPSDKELQDDWASCVEYGMVLHTIKDIPALLDGAASTIPANSYLYVLRWDEALNWCEVQVVDGGCYRIEITHLPDETWMNCIGGLSEDTYFDNIQYAG